MRAALAGLGSGVLLMAGCGGGGGEFPAGEWIFTSHSGGIAVAYFRPDGTWEYFNGPSRRKLLQVSSGRYSTTGEVLTFEVDILCESAHPGIKPGTYNWKVQEEQLTLTPLYEPCVERRGVMGGLTFSRARTPETPAATSG